MEAVDIRNAESTIRAKYEKDGVSSKATSTQGSKTIANNINSSNVIVKRFTQGPNLITTTTTTVISKNVSKPLHDKPTSSSGIKIVAKNIHTKEQQTNNSLTQFLALVGCSNNTM
jgi:hypothetical protein